MEITSDRNIEYGNLKTKGISDRVIVSDHLPLSVHLECEVNVIK